MNFAAIDHRPTDEYLYPKGRDALALELVTAKDDVEEAYLFYWPRQETDPRNRVKVRLRVSLRDARHDYYRTTVTTKGISAYTRYAFCLKKGVETVWYGGRGIEAKDPGTQENFFEFLWPNPMDCDRAPSWARDQIYYQIFPERFCSGDETLTPEVAAPWGSAPTRENFMGGDLRGILQKLDYLQELGVTCMYLTPIFKSPSNHKYDTADYFEVDPAFGTKKDLRELVAEVHRRGMRILLDGVFNHCGYDWPYFQDLVRRGARSPYRGWFFPRGFPITADPCNYDCVGHYKWMPKINLSCPAAERYFIGVGEYWVREFGIDGWRLDVADEVPTSFWTAFSTALKRLKPDVLLLGETWGDAKRLVSPDRLDTAMNYLFRDAAVDWLAKEAIPPSELDHRLNHILSLYTDEVGVRLYNPLDSHDTARFRYLCRDGARQKLAVALQMTFAGCPAVYYGDEVGLSGGNDPGCRGAMEWDAGKQDGELLTWYRALIRLRKASPSLLHGQFRSAFCDDAANVFAFYRVAENEETLVVINAGIDAYRRGFPEDYAGGVRYARILRAEPEACEAISPEQARYGIELEPRSVGIYQKKVKVSK